MLGEFFLFFFGGSGALGIGGAQIPKLLDQFKAISALKGGVTLGGEDLDVSPIALIGYPEPLKTNDILSIINKFPSIDTILSKVRSVAFLVFPINLMLPLTFRVTNPRTWHSWDIWRG